VVATVIEESKFIYFWLNTRVIEIWTFPSNVGKEAATLERTDINARMEAFLTLPGGQLAARAGPSTQGRVEEKLAEPPPTLSRKCVR
jgi:hypothetical protein